MSRQIFFDTETTGLSAETGDRIIEIGAVEMINRKLTGNNLHLYVNPGRDSHEDALKVHGISNEFLKDKPKFAEIAEELVEFLRGSELIIHNAAFDVGFLNKEFELIGRPGIQTVVASVTDSLVMAKELFPGKRNSLDALCDRLEVDNSGRTLHGALLDAELLADVYINMTRGQDALIVDIAPTEQGALQVQRVDLRQFTLPVLMATEQELGAHDAVVVQIDKSAGGESIWRKFEKTVA